MIIAFLLWYYALSLNCFCVLLLNFYEQKVERRGIIWEITCLAWLLSADRSARMWYLAALQPDSVFHTKKRLFDSVRGRFFLRRCMWKKEFILQRLHKYPWYPSAKSYQCSFYNNRGWGEVKVKQFLKCLSRDLMLASELLTPQSSLCCTFIFWPLILAHWGLTPGYVIHTVDVLIFVFHVAFVITMNNLKKEKNMPCGMKPYCSICR